MHQAGELDQELEFQRLLHETTPTFPRRNWTKDAHGGEKRNLRSFRGDWLVGGQEKAQGTVLTRETQAEPAKLAHNGSEIRFWSRCIARSHPDIFHTKILGRVQTSHLLETQITSNARPHCKCQEHWKTAIKHYKHCIRSRSRGKKELTNVTRDLSSQTAKGRGYGGRSIQGKDARRGGPREGG